MITKTMAVECAQTAAKHMNEAAMKSSAILCWSDAVSLIEQGKYEYAMRRALKSLMYSVGILNAEFTKHYIVYNDNSSMDPQVARTLSIMDKMIDKMA